MIIRCSPNFPYFIKMHHSAQDLSTQHILARNVSHFRKMSVRRFFIWIKVTAAGQVTLCHMANCFFDSTWDLISCDWKQNMLFVSLQRGSLPAHASHHRENRVQWQRHTNCPESSRHWAAPTVWSQHREGQGFISLAIAVGWPLSAAPSITCALGPQGFVPFLQGQKPEALNCQGELGPTSALCSPFHGSKQRQAQFQWDWDSWLCRWRRWQNQARDASGLLHNLSCVLGYFPVWI